MQTASVANFFFTIIFLFFFFFSFIKLTISNIIILLGLLFIGMLLSEDLFVVWPFKKQSSFFFPSVVFLLSWPMICYWFKSIYVSLLFSCCGWVFFHECQHSLTNKLMWLITCQMSPNAAGSYFSFSSFLFISILSNHPPIMLLTVQVVSFY